MMMFIAEAVIAAVLLACLIAYGWATYRIAYEHGHNDGFKKGVNEGDRIRKEHSSRRYGQLGYRS